MTQEKSPSAIRLYDLACLCSLGSAAVQQDVNLLTADRTKSAEKYAGRAVAHLTQAVAAGYFNDPKKLDELKTDTHMDPLRVRSDFKKLLAELEKKATAPEK